MGLPLKENYPAIGDNFEKCNKRLLLLKENLDKKPEFLKQYNDIINDQLEKGVIEVVSDENENIEKGK